MNDDELAGELAEALHGSLCSCEQADAGTGFMIRDADISKAMAALLPVVLADRRRAVAEAEQRGYDRARRDYQFAPEGDNHHNAALCPYCTPARADAVEGGGR